MSPRRPRFGNDLGAAGSRLLGCTLALALVAAGLGCGGKEAGEGGGGDGGDGGDVQRRGSVRGRLAAPASTSPVLQGLAALSGLAQRLLGAPELGQSRQGLSLDEVTVDLLRVDGNASPESWPVEKTATPDAQGAFAFDDLPEGSYALKVNQPEFATVAYRVDSTEFQLGAGQTVSLVLPLITTIHHGQLDPWLKARPGGAPAPAMALDEATGEVIILSNMGLALVDPGRGTLDLVFSRNFFPGSAAIALAPQSRALWLLYSDRIVRIDRALFSDPEGSETVNLDDVATRQALGDKIRLRFLVPPQGYSGYSFGGSRYFSPDEKLLYASTGELGVMVVDLEKLEVVRVIMGRMIGFNPISNHLFFTNGSLQSAWNPSQVNDGTEVLVVDASTRLEVNVVALDNVRGVAPVPGEPRTVLVGSKLSTADAQVPFIKIVDGAGAVVVDQRARDYLGVSEDPPAAAPSFDLAGDYFMLGSAAFRVLDDGGFERVPTGIAPGQQFRNRVEGCSNARAVDPAHRYELWYGCPQEWGVVGLLSLDQTNVPVAVRPGMPTLEVLLDSARGRAIFGDATRLVVVHYADPAAAGRPEVLDLSPLVAPLVPEGAPCSASSPCSGTDVCAGATDTSFSGRCRSNPRLPYLPFCGGFGQASCDEGFTCSKTNPTNPNSTGQCQGLPSRDYAAHGPVCGTGGACPVGMRCGTGGRCEPKACLEDVDCAAVPGEVCGSVENLGRVCLAPGTLPDGALCLASEECEHGACSSVKGAWQMSGGYLGDMRFGPYGLRVCTSPCFEDADCSGGGLCVYSSPGWSQSFAGSEWVWKAHRVPLMPTCRQPLQGPLSGCDGVCTGEELCAERYQNGCQVGFEPVAWTWLDQASGSTTQACLPPAQQNNGCRYPCRRSGDCPFATDCANGFCATPGPFASACGQTCAADESCAWFMPDAAGKAGVCLALDSCDADADCGGAAGSCSHGVCLAGAGCTTNADCASGECVDVGPTYVAERYCMPAHCGCTGADAPGAVCRRSDRTCIIQRTCTDLPCDGSVDPVCSPSAPDPLPAGCVCPGCSWNTGGCFGNLILTCPASYACTDLSMPPMPGHVGRYCACASGECQMP